MTIVCMVYRCGYDFEWKTVEIIVLRWYTALSLTRESTALRLYNEDKRRYATCIPITYIGTTSSYRIRLSTLMAWYMYYGRTEAKTYSDRNQAWAFLSRSLENEQHTIKQLTSKATFNLVVVLVIYMHWAPWKCYNISLHFFYIFPTSRGRDCWKVFGMFCKPRFVSASLLHISPGTIQVRNIK